MTRSFGAAKGSARLKSRVKYHHQQYNAIHSGIGDNSTNDQKEDKTGLISTSNLISDQGKYSLISLLLQYWLFCGVYNLWLNLLYNSLACTTEQLTARFRNDPALGKIPETIRGNILVVGNDYWASCICQDRTDSFYFIILYPLLRYTFQKLKTWTIGRWSFRVGINPIFAQ